jgi:hypothetical protein
VTDRAVLKWDVPVDDTTHRIGGGQIVHVGCQYASDVVTVWTVEPRRGATTRRRVQVFNTGHPLPYFAEHVGTAMAANGALVWHLFELPEVTPVLPPEDGVIDVELPEADMADATTRVAP